MPKATVRAVPLQARPLQARPAPGMLRNLPRLQPVSSEQQLSPGQQLLPGQQILRRNEHDSDECSSSCVSEDEAFDGGGSLPAHESSDSTGTGSESTGTGHLRLLSDVVAERVCGVLPHSFPPLGDEMEAAILQVRQWAADASVGGGSHGAW